MNLLSIVYSCLVALSCLLSVLTVAVFASGDIRTTLQFMCLAGTAVIAAGLVDVLGQRT